jgi:two-component system, OmpR family, heavy metal sensor histidine kinase CusS
MILLDNAVKYTPSYRKILISLYSRPGHVCLDVTDNGIGILPDDIGRVFDRFYRADPSRNRDQGGTGLGLAIAKWIAEVHGAEITVVSNLRVGSSFRIVFPAGLPLSDPWTPSDEMQPESVHYGSIGAG